MFSMCLCGKKQKYVYLLSKCCILFNPNHHTIYFIDEIRSFGNSLPFGFGFCSFRLQLFFEIYENGRFFGKCATFYGGNGEHGLYGCGQSLRGYLGIMDAERV